MDPLRTHAPAGHTPLDRIAGAHLPDGTRVDIDLDHGTPRATVAAVTPAGSTPEPDGTVLDASGHLALTAPAEPHAHLDKALSWPAVRTPAGDLGAAITAWRAFAAGTDQDEIAGRARTAAAELLARGTTAVRTHVDLHTTGDPLRGIRALAAVRRELADSMDVEIVVLTRDEPEELVLAALDAGADLVGGAPHLSPDPLAETDRLTRIAEEAGRGVDLHTDEHLGGRTATLPRMAERVRHWPAGRARTAGHCCALSILPPEELDALVPDLLAAGIGVVGLPVTNLFLQGHDHPVATPRGIAPLRALAAAGVPVAAGADNVRDPFNPMGRSDAFETAMLLVVAGHMGIEQAWEAVSDGARALLGLPAAGPRVGAAAELLLVRAADLPEAVATAPADRLVVHDGRLVSALATVAVDPVHRNHPSPVTVRS